MTSTPVSLNDESLNGSWIDIHSASQIHSPMDNNSPEFLRPPYSLAESVQSIGLISFQVERFLQEAHRNQNSQMNLQAGDDNSATYSYDTDTSIDSLVNCLKSQQKQNQSSSNEGYNTDAKAQRLALGGDCSLADQLSDSLSLMSISGMDAQTLEQDANFQDFDWLWDWTSQPEYFTGQEWKVYSPKQKNLGQRQFYCANLDKENGGSFFSGEVISLLFLTNILSIIIGAGLTYSIIMRKSNI